MIFLIFFLVRDWIDPIVILYGNCVSKRVSKLIFLFKIEFKKKEMYFDTKYKWRLNFFLFIIKKFA